MQLIVRIATVSCLLSMGGKLPLAAAQAAPPPLAPATVTHPNYPTGTATAIGQQIAVLLADPAVSRAHWGIAVTALDGTPLYGLDEGKLFRPASNNKIFTTATAVAILGPDKTFTTRIFGKLDFSTGTVIGDLDLVGGGDANFGADDLPYIPRSERPQPSGIAQQPTAPSPQPPALADLASLADQLVAKGVKRITGDIVGDDRLFPYEPYAESWAQDDQVWGYGAPVSALSIDNNQLKLTIPPGTITGLPNHEAYNNASAVLEQNGIPYYTVVSHVDVAPAGSRGDVQVERLPGSRIIHVYGQMAVDARPDIEYVAIADPAEYAAMALRGILEQRGIVVTGVARALHQPVRDGNGFLSGLHAPTSCEDITIAGGECAGGCAVALQPGEMLASHTSAQLGEDVVLTNKISQNLHAELLFHHLGRLVTCGNGSIVEGARMVRAYLIHTGVDPDDFVFFDGSGLSDHDLIAPRATVTFLAFVAKQPWFSAWKASLPDSGEDGSLSARFPNPPLKGHIFAKTGTLGESRALSGYLDAASGRTLIFSIFADDHTPGTSEDRATMDKIITTIAAAE